MENKKETAYSGKEETLREVLERIQSMRVKRESVSLPCPLMQEKWDWLVVLQCMQDHNLFKSNPHRPPFKEFAAWLKENDMPQWRACMDVRSVSYAYTKIQGTRYPWDGVIWQVPVLKRWRMLYKQLSICLDSLSDNEM